jgi:hypothetical protein
MEELLSVSKIDKVALKNYINKVVATELGKLNEPCYAPPYKHYYGEEILQLTGLTVKDIRDFSKRFHTDRLAADYVLKDTLTNILLFTLYYFSLQKDLPSFMATMILLCINFYSHRFYVHFRDYCNSEVFSYTLDNISKTNLMSREKTIPNFLYHIAQEMHRRYKKDLETFDDPERISRFVYECRHRIAQTIRSFAELYYKYSKEGIEGYSPSEKEGSEGTYEIESLKKGQRVIEDIVSKITIYKEVDRKAFDDAKKLSRINILFAEYIVDNLSDLKYADDIRLIYELFLKNINSMSQLCGKDFLKYTSDLMGIKRTNQKIYYKQQVSQLTEKIITDSKYKKSYQKLTNQTKFLTQSFTSFYLAMFLRNKVC